MTAEERTLEEFQRIEGAEEYLEFFDLPFDPHVLAVHRMRLLKRLGSAVRAVDAGNPRTDELRLRCYGEALRAIYQGLARPDRPCEGVRGSSCGPCTDC